MISICIEKYGHLKEQKTTYVSYATKIFRTYNMSYVLSSLYTTKTGYKNLILHKKDASCVLDTIKKEKNIFYTEKKYKSSIDIKMNHPKGLLRNSHYHNVYSMIDEDVVQVSCRILLYLLFIIVFPMNFYKRISIEMYDQKSCSMVGSPK